MSDAMYSVGMACSLGRSRRVPCGMGWRIFPVSVVIEELGEVVAGAHAHTLAAHGTKASAPKPWPPQLFLGKLQTGRLCGSPLRRRRPLSVVPRRCFMASRAKASARGCLVVPRPCVYQRCFQSSGGMMGRSDPRELALFFDQ